MGVLFKSKISEITAKHSDQYFISIHLSFWTVYFGPEYLLNHPIPWDHPCWTRLTSLLGSLEAQHPVGNQHKEEKDQWTRPGECGLSWSKVLSPPGNGVQTLLLNLGPKPDLRANEAKASGQIYSRDNYLISQGQSQHLDLGPLPGKQAASVIKEGPTGGRGWLCSPPPPQE